MGVGWDGMMHGDINANAMRCDRNREKHEIAYSTRNEKTKSPLPSSPFKATTTTTAT